MDIGPIQALAQTENRYMKVDHDALQEHDVIVREFNSIMNK
jgi:hypothetical protein